MNKRFFALLMVLALIGATVSAQINQANKLFESYSYSLAIPYYLKIAQKADNIDRNEAIVKLADCYRLTNDQLNAKAWYAQAVKLPGSNPLNWFYYGQALRCAQDYDLAKEAYDKYAELSPADPRGKAYSGFCTNIEKLNDLPAAFEVKNAKNLNTDHSEFGPAFFGEGIIYVSDRRQNFMENKRYEWTNNNYLDLFFARPRYLDEFYQDMNEPKSFAGQFNQTYHDGPATFANHDSLIYFSRTERGNQQKDADNFRTDKLKIYQSLNVGTWSKAEPFFLNSEAYSVGHPALTPDGKTLYFVSDMPGGYGGTDIYICKWENGKWGLAKNLGDKINSFGNEMFPSINGDKLYFASDGWPGFGGLDIFCSSFSNGTWSKPDNLGLPLNSSFDDFSLVLDARGKKGFFSSNRPGGVGNDDIYACKRLDKKAKSKSGSLYANLSEADTATISGFVKNKQTLKPISGSTVFLLNTMTGKAKVLKTDPNGQFKAPVEKGVFYVVKSMDNNYLADCLSFEIASDDTATKANTPRDLLLDLLEMNKVFTLNNMNLDIENIYYDFDKWYIRPDAEVELDKLVQIMKENPVNIELGSHTDCRGSAPYNIELSQKRAESVVRYVVLQGIESKRLSAKGYGESKLTNRCSDGVACSPAEHQANRRSEFKITGFNTPDDNTRYDMNKFKTGDEIPVYMFDRDFFINCLQDKLKSEPIDVPAKEALPAEMASTVPKTSNPAESATSASKSTKTADPGKEITQPAQAAETTIIPGKTAEPATTVKTNAAIEKGNPVNKPGQGNISTKTDAITFRVQVYALSRFLPLNSAEFANLEDIQRYEEDGLYKYTAGIFKTTEEAHAYRDMMVDMGFEDAFVVTFENGKRVNIEQANK
jgi:outer membrane protein OmpA-like peptidoglycan-associated protein/tetratricopeptide (TPR) repeat protein